MAYFAKAHMGTQSRVSSTRKHARMPDPEGPEADYVTTLKHESPFESITLLGTNFDKRILPRAAHFLENQGKYYEPGVLVRTLAANQVEALRKRAEEVEMRWRGEDNAFKSAPASAFIVLCTLQEYAAISFPAVQVAQPPVHPKQIEFDVANAPGDVGSDDVREKLYEQQRKRK